MQQTVGEESNLALEKTFIEHGILISEDKSVAATQEPIFCGYKIDLKLKRLYLKTETANKLRNIIRPLVRQEDPLSIPRISFSSLEEILGLINWAANVCHVGRCRMFYLNKLLNDNRELQPERILIEAKVRAELLFWYEYDLEGNDNQGGFDMRLGKIVTCDLKVLHDASGHTG